MIDYYLHRKEYILFYFSFSKKFLNLDFFSKIPLVKTNDISLISLSTTSSINESILSVALFIIIIFSLSKKDLLEIFSLNIPISLITSFSSYLKILPLRLGLLIFSKFLQLNLGYCRIIKSIYYLLDFFYLIQKFYYHLEI